MRLIDIEPFESGKDICGCSIQIRRWGDGYNSVCSISTADIPTIDAVPVVHAKWVKPSKIGGLVFDMPHCSACNEVPCDVRNYCPFCGAEMDGERKE